MLRSAADRQAQHNGSGSWTWIALLSLAEDQIKGSMTQGPKLSPVSSERQRGGNGKTDYPEAAVETSNIEGVAAHGSKTRRNQIFVFDFICFRF